MAEHCSDDGGGSVDEPRRPRPHIDDFPSNLFHCESILSMLDPSTACNLVRVNSRFNSAACKALYEELCVQDDANAIAHPISGTRYDTSLLRQSAASFIAMKASWLRRGHLTLKSSRPSSNASPIWKLFFGPAEHHCEGHLRWEAPRLSSLHCLRVLSLSKLSSDGVNQLHMVLQFAPMLEKMTIESLFIDDALLAHVGKLRYLTNLTLRSSGTKISDKGILSLLEGCASLRSLMLTEVEGRLTKGLWSKVPTLPSSFHTLKVAFSENGSHHSWTTDHLSSLFDILSMRLITKPDLIPVSLPNLQHSDDQSQMMDMFFLTPDELQLILSSCKRLQHLRICLDAPISKLLAMSSAFVRLPHLETLAFSITEQHCPSSLPLLRIGGPVLAQPLSRIHERPISRPDATVPELSPSSTEASGETELATPVASTKTEEALTHRRRRSSISTVKSDAPCLGLGLSIPTSLFNTETVVQVDVQTANGSLTSHEATIPPTREIRKNGKGEWQITGNGATAKINFVPFHQVDDYASELLTLDSGADVEEALIARRTSSFGSLKDPSTAEALTVFPSDPFEEVTVGSPTLVQQLQQRKRSNTVDGGAALRASITRPRSSTLGTQAAVPQLHKSASSRRAPILTQLKKTPVPENAWGTRLSSGPALAASSSNEGTKPAKSPSSPIATAKKASLVINTGSNSKPGGRAMTRLRGPDDGYSGPTVIIGHGKPSTGKSSKKKHKQGSSSPNSTKGDMTSSPLTPKHGKDVLPSPSSSTRNHKGLQQQQQQKMLKKDGAKGSGQGVNTNGARR
ncbi:hypothetical protein FA10DRAFT_290249 [Acaromyces ingoldii]|uniref:F-box domain-containing protein n=1 Tax=Acaromyces ingoldii TaxID=215250 RepID=A0A316YWQ0_9BASI|nr:hypothetical protein FA10DRAFT_290249 [Acaromyces ingoldii]PWN93098.1 hypothetical protein FA10DRAFT_290249 [Acaromyces ingoldii]